VGREGRQPTALSRNRVAYPPRVDLHSVVASHYGRTGLEQRILDGLAAAGLDGKPLTPADLAPVDEFHIRGRLATTELALLAEIERGERVLDVGAGLGGPARHLAAEFGAEVVGADLTPEYCEVARLLTERAGLEDSVSFHLADALELPFDDGEFDVVWTQHAAMNIPDKERLYGELGRVLRQGGRLALYDVTAGPGGQVHFPVPWATGPELSFLATPDELRRLVEASGLEIVAWRDVSAPAADWFRERLAAVQGGSPPPLGLHLLLGADAPIMFGNMLRSLEEERIVLIQLVARKPEA